MNLYKEYKEEKIEEQCKKRDQEFLSSLTSFIQAIVTAMQNKAIGILG